MDEHEYIDFLSNEGPSSVSGNAPPGDSNLNQAFLGREYPPYQHQHQQHNRSSNDNRTPYRTMAALPSTRSTRPTRANAGQSRHEYFANDQPVVYAFKWNSVDIPIPKLAPTTETSHVKTVIYNRLIENIRKTDTKWNLKTDVLEHLFQTIAPSAGTQADTALTDLGNYVSGVFEFADAELLNMNLLPLNANLQNDLPNVVRRNTKWIRMQLTFRPRSAQVGALGIDNGLFPNSSIVPVYLKALRNEEGHLDEQITSELLRISPVDLVTLYFENGADFELAQLHRSTNVPDIDIHDRWLREQKAKTKYEALAQLIEPVYVGELEGTETVSKRLYKINQRHYDEASRGYIFSTVEELNQKFQGVLQEIKPYNPPNDLPDLCQLFYQATTKDLQNKTVRLLPGGNPVNFNHNLARLNEFVIEVVRQERDLKSLITIARRAAGPSRINRASPAGSAFMNTQREHQDEQQDQGGNGQDWNRSQQYKPSASTRGDNAYITTTAGNLVLPRAFIATQQDSTEESTIKNTLTQTLTALSLAEQALRDASGTRSPPQCFGCAGLQAYEKKCNHLFRDCPHKEDPQVIENFKISLQAFRDRRNGQRNRTWKEAGYPNKTMAALVKVLADPETPETATITLLAELKQEMEHIGLGPRREGHPKRPADIIAERAFDAQRAAKRPPERRLGLNFFTYPTGQAPATNVSGRSFFGQPKHKYEFNLTTNLPFLQLPIGTGEDSNNKANLSGLFDSGGCCNMGWLDYHQKINAKFPHLIAEFTDLNESQYETFDIGGIKDSIQITHMIKYWLPYQTNGATATITIGLSPDMPLDTLYGLPFQINSHMTADFANQKVVSKIFNAEFDLLMKRPERSPIESLDYPSSSKPKVLMFQDNFQHEE
jgi:hypothetical protein